MAKVTSSYVKTRSQNYVIMYYVLLYSSLVLSIYNFDDDDYLIMYVILDVMQSYTLCNFICYIVLLTCSISEAYAFMDFVELQINMNMNM
jgi:hypothetical protein